MVTRDVMSAWVAGLAMILLPLRGVAEQLSRSAVHVRDISVRFAIADDGGAAHQAILSCIQSPGVVAIGFRIGSDFFPVLRASTDKAGCASTSLQRKLSRNTRAVASIYGRIYDAIWAGGPWPDRIAGVSSLDDRTSEPLPIPLKGEWESNMTSFGTVHCGELSDSDLTPDDLLAMTYYDAESVYYQIADYTHDSSWNDCARRAGAIYRDSYVLPNDGKIPAYWNFTNGLTEDFLRSGDMLSQQAVFELAGNAAFASDDTPENATVDNRFSREVAYLILAYLNSARVGGEVPERLTTLVEQSLGHFEQWFFLRSADYVRPFMVALSAQALIRYYDYSGDPRVLRVLVPALDYMWEKLWLSQQQAFRYTDRDLPTGGREPAPDLNMLIAPAYAWVYHQTGLSRFMERADSIFAGGVRGAYLAGAKQFDQNYRWSVDFVRWREAEPLFLSPF